MSQQIKPTVNKNQRTAQTAGRGVQPRVVSFYVFSEFTGAGHAKLPLAAFHTQAEADEFAQASGGYVVEFTGGKR